MLRNLVHLPPFCTPPLPLDALRRETWAPAPACAPAKTSTVRGRSLRTSSVRHALPCPGLPCPALPCPLSALSYLCCAFHIDIGTPCPAPPWPHCAFLPATPCPPHPRAPHKEESLPRASAGGLHPSALSSVLSTPLSFSLTWGQATSQKRMPRRPPRIRPP